MGNYLDSLLTKGEAIRGALRLVQDNWQNVFTGLGTSRDKTAYGQFVALVAVPDGELSALYHQEDVARRIVAFKPREMMRQGFVVQVEDDTEASEATAKRLRELRAASKILDAMIWGRLYGGGAVLIGADDGQTADKPLREDAIKTIKFLHVIDRRFLTADSYFNDPIGDEFFGEPKTYTVTPRTGRANMLKVHRSRLLIFGGAHASDEERDRQGGWDHSILTVTYQALRQSAHVWQAAEHLMSDASQGVFKLKGLMAMIAGGNKDVLQTRMELVDMSRSVARALLLDADGEDFDRKPSSFTDAQNMLEKFMMRVAAAAEIPVTILFGRSPAGMNATGDADFRHFYDTVKTDQENVLRPELEKLIRLVFLAKDGPTGGREPENWGLTFNPLWQPTPQEQADLELKHAQKDQVYIDKGVVLPEEITLSRFRAEGWSPITVVDREAREAVLEAELERMQEEPEDEPPPAPPPVPPESQPPQEPPPDAPPQEDEQEDA